MLTVAVIDAAGDYFPAQDFGQQKCTMANAHYGTLSLQHTTCQFEFHGTPQCSVVAAGDDQGIKLMRQSLEILFCYIGDWDELVYAKPVIPTML